jgi:uncharacterized protein (DUF362 family)
MEGNGPIQGTPKPAGVLVAGRDRAAVDATCCRIMRIEPFKIEYLRLTSGGGSHITERNIHQIGESLSAVATPFAVIPELRWIRMENS